MIEGIGSLLSDAVECFGEVRLNEAIPRAPRAAIGMHEDAMRFLEAGILFIETAKQSVQRRGQVRIDGRTAARQLGRRFDEPLPREAAKTLMSEPQPAHRSGHADRSVR